MAATGRSQHQMKQKLQKEMNDPNFKDKDTIEKLRIKCLARGATGIKGLGRTFKIFDDDGSKSLDKSEFMKGIKDYGVTDISKTELQELFDQLDTDGSGKLDFDEFLTALRPPMSKTRRDIIERAFQKLDKTGDGQITVEDLKGVYNVKKHPKYLNGEWTEDQCLRTFLDSFDSKDKDGVITKDEFQNYYSGVSASIDSDCYFTLMMTNAWKL